MEINRKELKTALEIVKPGLAGNDTIEQTTSFCFINGHVVTYNDEISVRYPIDVDIEGAVNASELYGFINKVSCDEITIEIEDSELRLKAGKSKAGLTLESKIVLPIKDIGDIDEWNKLPKDFLKSVDFARAACSKDSTRAILTCINVKDNIVQGADNHRIARTELDDTVNVNEFLIPSHVAGTVVQLKPIRIAESDGWIHFKTKNHAIISCRVFDDEYVNTEKLLKITGDSITFPDAMSEILEKASVFGNNSSLLQSAITIDLQSKKLIVSSKSESGWFEEKARVEYSGEPIKFSIALYVLNDILERTNKATISGNKLLFEADNWKYLTMLMV